MSEIKSALELALERTADVKGDRSLIEAHEAKQRGMKLAGSLIDNPDTNAAAELKRMGGANGKKAREGFISVLISHLSLPAQESDLARLRTVTAGLSAVARDPGAIAAIMEQVDGLLHQYLDNKGQLVESLRQQFAPRIRQQEQEIAKQTGTPVKLDPASDPEFAKALSANMKRLQSQYNQVIEQAKEQLKTYL